MGAIRKDIVESAFKTLLKESDAVVDGMAEEVQLGWIDSNIGDRVYFSQTGPDGLRIMSGTVIGVNKQDRRMWNNPNSAESDGEYKVYTTVQLTVECHCGQFDIDSRLVHKDRTSAALAAINALLHSYFN